MLSCPSYKGRIFPFPTKRVFLLVLSLFFVGLVFFKPVKIAYAGVGSFTTSTIPLSWDTFTGTAVTGLPDDGVSAAITIPFAFTFYGNSYTQFLISSNGFISFDLTSGSYCCSGTALPSTSAPKSSISGWWTDLYPPGAGTVQYTTLGNAPNRRFVVQFSGIPACCGTTPDVTFEIKLFEGSNNIEIHYNGTTHTTGTVTAGVQDDTQTLGTADLSAASGPTKTNTATAYYPITSPSLTSPAASVLTATTASLSATINPNNATATSFFLWGTSNVACSSLPNITTTQSFSGSTSASLTATIQGLVPGATYYYCGAGYNSIGMTHGTVASFTQTIGGSTCTSSITNSDYTVTGSCVFANTIDGVDKGTGTQNTGVLAISPGQGLTVNSNQTVAYGILYKPGATLVRFSGGVIKRGALWIPDSDGDGFPDNADNTGMIVSDTAPANYVRRSLFASVDCAPNDATKWRILYGATDNDNDGVSPANSFTRPVCSGATLASGYTASAAGADCDDSNANVYQNVANLATDADHDGYYINSGTTQCVGGTSTINTRSYYKNSTGVYSLISTGAALGANDCDDTDATKTVTLTGYQDFDNDGYTQATGVPFCLASLPTGYKALNGNDCDDFDATKYQWLDGYANTDADAVCAPGRTKICSGASLPAGACSTAGTDCNDVNAATASAATNFTDISVSILISCGVVSGGGVKCWGYNQGGELGDGTTTDRNTPVSVTGVTTATSVKVGYANTCILLSGGTVKCWGRNQFGEIGNGTTNVPATSPQPVTGITTATAIAAGGNHMCALLASGSIQCWGNNGQGQLGNGTTTDSNVPVTVTGITTATKVTAGGGTTTCALLTGGTVKCWGDGNGGKLGNGGGTNSTTPVSVTGITTATDVYMGDYTGCATLSGGTVQCWGWSSNSSESNTNYYSPQTITGITTATSTVSGRYYSCAVLSGGTVQCWGENNLGQLGNNSFVSTDITPVSVLDLSSVSKLGAGDNGICALLTSGQVRCWGGNSYSTYGNGTITTKQVTPVTIRGVTNASKVAGQTYGTADNMCAVLSTGGVKCWGISIGLGVGQSGDPTYIPGIFNATSVSLGTGAYCALISDGTVKCWGSNGSGQLGNGTNVTSNVPVTVSGITTATSMSMGGFTPSACVVLTGGTVKCWGDNSSGQLGNGTLVSSNVPVSVTGITNATSVTVGSSFACALLSDSTIKCWGNNYYGNLGNGNTTNSSTPVAVSGITTATSVNSSGQNVCARLSDSTVKCWGYNGQGQLGNGTYYSSSTPVSVTGITTATSVFGSDESCAILADNSVKCWGANYIGDGTANNSTSPVTISAIANATSVGVTYQGRCASISGGSVKCWGNAGTYGSIGDTPYNTSTPQNAICQ